MVRVMVIGILLTAISTVIVGMTLPFIASDGSTLVLDRDTFIKVCPLH